MTGLLTLSSFLQVMMKQFSRAFVKASYSVAISLKMVSALSGTVKLSRCSSSKWNYAFLWCALPTTFCSKLSSLLYVWVVVSSTTPGRNREE